LKRPNRRSVRPLKKQVLVLTMAYLVLLAIIPHIDPVMMNGPGHGPLPVWSPINLRLKFAIVKPVFTATAYSSYYTFYSKYSNAPRNHNITTDLGLLNVTLVDGWGWSNGLREFAMSKTARDFGLVVGKNLAILTDVNATQGGLFNNDGSNKYDVTVLGFSEYVSTLQYQAYRHFVAQGGRLILMDAVNFLAEVRYYPLSRHLALVSGHGWGFDGKRVWFDLFERWRDESRNWVGSNFCCSTNRYSGAVMSGNHSLSLAMRQAFGPLVFTSYHGHEENQVTNMTGTVILARWVQTPPDLHKLIATYLHRYVNGTVIHIGVMASDVISFDQSVQAFLASCILNSQV
jgi:hypothetical protein